MIRRNAENGLISFSGSQIYRERMREAASIKGMLLPIESLRVLGAGLKNEFLVEGLLGLGAAMGIAMVAVLIKAGCLQ